ncbi:MAG: hydantoinase B/oxoprolinase family protein [Candidatus Latescibacteria bacterium]|nr:hydantoinase B/oxoprolinase family protein [Candidatus Latescibacterota bacterium]
MSQYNPIELELLKNGLESIVDEMALTVVRTAYSTNLRNSMDFSTGLCTPDGDLIAQGLCLPLHLGSLPDGMSAVLNRYADAIHEGDLFILNDPYEGGTHLPDIYLYRPIFIDGELLAFAAAIAHHTDIGGRVAGGNACDSTEIYQEGLRIPPLKLHEAGRPVQAIFDLIERNVRVPQNALGDLRAQMAACHIAERELRKLTESHGRGRLSSGFGQLIEYAERLTRAEIAAFPDGVYRFTDVIDDDGIDPGPIPIVVTVTVDGSDLVVDFDGTAPQVKGAINCALSFTKSAAYACLRCLMDPGVPTNSGFFRAIDVRAPSATLVNPVLPAPVAARGLTGFRLANAVLGALAQMAPKAVPACEVGGDTGISIGGYRADRSPFVFLEFLFGAWGGRPDRDGIDGCPSVVVNFSNNPAEVVEAEYPLEILKYGFLPDTGGPGKHRGGLAMVREYRFAEAEGTLQIRSDRHRSRPYGLSGGKEGTASRNILNPKAEARDLPAKTLLTLKEGDILHHVLAGAGGWGDPCQRDPERVLEDVWNGKVSVAAAERDYGVAIDIRGPSVDLDRTRDLRSQRA